MYRFVVLVYLFGVVQGYCQPGAWSPFSQRSNSWRQSFDAVALEIAQDFIALDRKIQGFCQRYAIHDIKETYGMDNYMLTVSVPGFTDEDIKVKLMHRILKVSAMDCSKSYADVRLLPDVVDPSQTVWKYSQGELVILFAYKRPLDYEKCGGDIDDSVLKVPRSRGDCTFCGDSLDDGAIRNNVWHRSHSGERGSSSTRRRQQNYRSGNGIKHNGVFGGK